MLYPRIEIHLGKIRHNVKKLVEGFGRKGIQVTGVVKGVAADLQIVRTLIDAGLTTLADSKINQLKKLKKANIQAEMLLLRTPGMSEIEQVVQYADMSMNTELTVIRALSEAAIRQGKKHKIVLMVEMGDLREGVLLADAPNMIREIVTYPGIELVGIGTNFACFGGVLPTEQKMRAFSQFVIEMRRRFSLPLPFISGGNSANFNWAMKTTDVGVVNNIRLGELIYLGRETVQGQAIPSLFQDAFSFVGEVIESKVKPSVPFGETGKNAFGEVTKFQNRGWMRRAIIGAGRQDILVSGLIPPYPFELIGASSDHLLIDTKWKTLKPGDELSFFMNYGALLAGMTSPYVHKTYIDPKESTDSQVYKKRFFIQQSSRKTRT